MLRLSTLFKKTVLPTLTNKPRSGYSQIDQYMNRLQKPLYYYIIGANVGVFMLWNLPMIDKNFMYNNFTLSGDNLSHGRFHTLLTHGFSHYNLLHLGVNMITLYFFGRGVEQAFGSKRLLYVYLIGLMGGALMMNYDRGQACLGASSAVNAILTYYICNFPQCKYWNMIILFVIPVPAWVVGLIILFQSWQQSESNGAHLGGIIGGAAYFAITRGRRM